MKVLGLLVQDEHGRVLVLASRQPVPVIRKDDPVLNVPVAELAIHSRGKNALVKAGFRTIGDILMAGEDEVDEKTHLGPMAWDDLRNELAARGLFLGIKVV